MLKLLKTKQGYDLSKAAKLSQRQWEVLKAVRTFKDRNHAAQTLEITPNTLKAHLRLIYLHLGVKSILEAFRVAGLVENVD